MREPVRLLMADRPARCAQLRILTAGLCDVCAETHNATEAVQAASRHTPDLCLISSGLAGGGLDAVRGVARALPASTVIVLADHDDADDMLAAVRAGAVGWIPPSVGADELAKIIDAVIRREAVLPRAMIAEVMRELRGRGGRSEMCSPREAQILGMLRRGRSTTEIARRLEIAPVTVRRHISELVRKHGLSDRSQLIAARGW
jgi:two-component system, NarL family, nitrate/nitrite response regulator NarL